MTFNEVYKQAKSLSDFELQKLIDKLSTLQTKRAVKQAESQKAEQEKAEKAKQAIVEIEKAVKASGLSLNTLGLTSPVSPASADKRVHKRKPNQYDPQKQHYAIVDDSLVEILFGRKAGILKREGKAYTFDQLNQSQKQNALSIVSRLNSR